MSEKLYHHLNKFVAIDRTDFPEIFSYFNFESITKKEIIMHAGAKCTSTYFVLTGCLHMYFLDPKGTEQTIQFGIENWWITDALSFHYQNNTEFSIRAVENSEILRLDYSKQHELFEKFPEIENYFRHIYQIAYGASIMRIKYIFDYSKEEIFYRFRAQFPDFVNRVPQYLIASYLGLTPEYLSQIRSKSIS